MYIVLIVYLSTQLTTSKYRRECVQLHQHILLTWQPPAPSNQNGIIQHYAISVTEEETMRQFQLMSTTTSVTATALHPYYTYSFTISAVTVSEGPYSQTLSLRTLEDGNKDAAARELWLI